ncbi:aldo/keto reductase [Modestobacter sp. Leaf380]|uniref:aldo/keto reductase n=1 Tax=Modestobacter sp. Leaf380 TaxID=1736356 RepID=UPI0006F5CBF6|nr:aldo/keto reductase [Modestobacter sp. Leaf380]KQS73341.1 aldo/keto reductase [Modestobacter sp. Leaf380]
MTSVQQPTAALPGGGAMPLLGFGTWQITGEECVDAVRVALASGYRHLDTATMYRNEAEVGRALADSGVPREEVFVTTKLPPERASAARSTLEASLAALGLEQVDLWLVHWSTGGDDVALWREFVAAREAGLARDIGVSHFSPAQLDELTDATGVTPAVNQVRWAPSLFDADVLEGHRRRGVVLEGYSPFTSTDLDDPVLVQIAGAHGVTTAQVVLRWHLDHGVVVIPKSVTPERIEANADVLGFALTAGERDRVDGLADR